MIQEYVEAIVAFIKANEAWAAPIAFLLAFGESLAFISLILPSTVILLAIGGLIGSSGIELWPVIVAAGLGGSLGYALSYWIGLYFKEQVPHIWPFRSNPEMIPVGQKFFERYGLVSVFLGHFFGPVRAVIPVIAGMFRMPQIPFQIANVTSAFLWAPGVIAPGYIIAAYKEPIFELIRHHEIAAAGLLGFIALLQGLPNLALFGPLLILYVAAGALYLFAGGSFPLALAMSAVGCFIGDLLSYWLGRTYRYALHDIWSLDWYPRLVTRTKAYVKALGLPSVLLSKFMGARRPLVPLGAGAIDLPLTGFVLVSAVASVLWAAAFLSPRFILALFGI